jgi:hypothetical protein
MGIENLPRGSATIPAQVPVYDPSLGSDAKVSMESFAEAMLQTQAMQNVGVTGGLPDGNLGDVTKAGTTLTVPKLALKADASALRLDAPFVIAGTTTGSIDTSKQSNPRTIAGPVTLAFTAQPAQPDTYFGSALRNTTGADVIVTIPSCYSMRQQALITQIVLPANARSDLVWRWDGAAYLLYGEPVRDLFQAAWALVGTASAREYPVIMDNARPFVITGVVSKCTSGTDTAIVRIGGVALGGAPNAVSSTKQTQPHASANVAAVGADITVAFAGGAVDPQITLKGYFL